MLITSAKDLGLLVKRLRTQYGMTQSDLAGVSGTGVRFIVDLEKGKPTCRFDKALMVAAMLGIRFEALSPEAEEAKASHHDG